MKLDFSGIIYFLKNYKELMIYRRYDKVYNRDEYLLLLNSLPQLCVVGAILSVSTCLPPKLRTIKNIIKDYRQESKFTYLSEYFCDREPFIFEMMYTNPLNKMPLYINSKSFEIRAIASWRLQIKK